MQHEHNSTDHGDTAPEQACASAPPLHDSEAATNLEPSPAGAPPPNEITHIALNELEALVAVCTPHGQLVGATAACADLLSATGVTSSQLPVQLPQPLWEALHDAPWGEAVEWRPPSRPDLCVGMTAYRAGDNRVLMMMREITERNQQLSRRLHEQRLIAIGRMVAGITHDLRVPLSSIVFAAHVARARCEEMSTGEVRDCLHQISDAAERLQDTIAGMLQYARLGPTVHQVQSVSAIISSACNLLRHALRENGHTVSVVSHTSDDDVVGNRLMIEQIFVNLIQNAIEASSAPLVITLRIESLGHAVATHVIDDGPGLDDEARQRIFEPFYTTKSQGVGIGLTMSREAAGELGGKLETVMSSTGAHFILELPAADASQSAAGGGAR